MDPSLRTKDLAKNTTGEAVLKLIHSFARWFKRSRRTIQHRVTSKVYLKRIWFYYWRVKHKQKNARLNSWSITLKNSRSWHRYVFVVNFFSKWFIYTKHTAREEQLQRKKCKDASKYYESQQKRSCLIYWKVRSLIRRRIKKSCFRIMRVVRLLIKISVIFTREILIDAFKRWRRRAKWPSLIIFRKKKTLVPALVTWSQSSTRMMLEGLRIEFAINKHNQDRVIRAFINWCSVSKSLRAIHERLRRGKSFGIVKYLTKGMRGLKHFKSERTTWRNICTSCAKFRRRALIYNALNRLSNYSAAICYFDEKLMDARVFWRSRRIVLVMNVLRDGAALLRRRVQSFLVHNSKKVKLNLFVIFLKKRQYQKKCFVKAKCVWIKRAFNKMRSKCSFCWRNTCRLRQARENYVRVRRMVFLRRWIRYSRLQVEKRNILLYHFRSRAMIQWRRSTVRLLQLRRKFL